MNEIKLASFGIVAALVLISPVAEAQTLYVSSWNGGVGLGTINSIAPGGSVSTFATGLTSPMGLAFDSSGNLFEADTGNGNGVINKFTAAQVSSGSGTPTVFASGFTTPYGLTFNSAGDLYEADESHGDSLSIFPAGGGSPTVTGLNHNPGQIVFDSSGNLYIANISRGNMTILTTGGAQNEYQPGGFAGHPYGMAINSAGDLFISSDSGDIYEYLAGDLAGGATITFATGLNNPAGLTFDADGNLFEADNGSGKIFEFINTGGTLDSTPVTYAEGLVKPTFIAFGPAVPTPEPATWALMGIGAISLLGLRRR